MTHHKAMPIHDPVPSEPDDVFNYLQVKGDTRIELINDRIEEREKTLWEVEMMIAMLEGNPEMGTHREVKEDQQCSCGKCELKRDRKLRASLIYSINKLRALKGTLS